MLDSVPETIQYWAMCKLNKKFQLWLSKGRYHSPNYTLLIEVKYTHARNSSLFKYEVKIDKRTWQISFIRLFIFERTNKIHP